MTRIRILGIEPREMKTYFYQKKKKTTKNKQKNPLHEYL